MGRTRFEQVLRLSKPARVSGPPEGWLTRAARPSTGGRTVKVPGAARVERQSVRYAARAQPLDWLSDRHDHMSTVPVSLDPPDTTGALGYPASAAQGPWGRGSATSELDAGPAATDVVTSAVEHAAAEHALVLELARPRGWFRLAGRRRRNAPDRGRPRPPVPEAAPTRASSRSSPTGARGAQRRRPQPGPKRGRRPGGAS